MNRNVDMDVKEWIKKYNLENDSACIKCGVTYPFTIPFATDDFRGVTQEAHDCGQEYRQSVAVAIKPDDIEAFNKLFKNLNERGGV